MGPRDFYATDCESILSEIKNQEKLLKLKRRWLMGLPTSKSKRQWSRGPKFLKEYRSLPESVLREDDIFYETIKLCIEESFGSCNTEKELNFTQDNMQLDTHDITRNLISCLDGLTNKGLYNVAMLLTGGSVKFEKTRRQLKRVIRESLPEYIRNRNSHCWKNILKQLWILLNNPKNFRENCLTFLTPTLQSHHATLIKVLDGLEDLPFEALIVMHRKLRGVQGRIPQLRRHRHGRSRGHLIDRIRKTSKEMLSELGRGDKLQEPLVKAMAIAGLSLKLKPGYQNSSEMDFHQFSPEIKSLQNEMVKAIWLLKTKVRIQELKTLQQILDPNADVSNNCLRTAIKKMLIEYLFECNDMDCIPKSLLEALAVINRSSRSTPYRCFPKEEIEQEVECVLSVSAQTRQIVWDFLPDNEFDQDFAEAYMEELEESDDGDDDDSSDGTVNNGWHSELETQQNSRLPFVESDYRTEGVGESMPVDSKPPASATWENGPSAPLMPIKKVNENSVLKVEPEDCTSVDTNPCGTTSSLHFLESKLLHGKISLDVSQSQAESTGKICSSRSMDFFSSNILYEDAKFTSVKKSLFKNQYLAIQEVSDETSMVAYNLIGRMLEKFAQEDEVDLDYNDHSYLRGNSSNQEYSKGENHTSSEDVGGSIIVPMVEELMPSLPKSEIEKLKKLMGT